MVVNSGIASDGERQRRLAHTRPTRKQDQISWLKAAGEGIQVEKAAGKRNENNSEHWETNKL